MSDFALDALYSTVARAFALHINDSFHSEDSLKELWEGKFGILPFDRTSNWNLIIRDLLEKCWNTYGPLIKSRTTPYDRDQVVMRLVTQLDYNIFTQVLLNVQDMSPLRYAVEDADKDAAEIAARWADAKLSPTTPKAKMCKNAATEEEHNFNRDLSALKAMRIVAGFMPSTSFRVTPRGSTPALADSSNISTLGFGGDRYMKLPEGFSAYFFNLEDAEPASLTLAPTGNEFYAKDIATPFVSKSGGDVLQQTLSARRLAASLYSSVMAVKVIIPRFGSVLLIAQSGYEEKLATEGYKFTVGPR